MMNSAEIESETPEMEGISEVFRDLRLADPKAREGFRQLAEPSDWHSWRKEISNPHYTRNNTANEEEHAQLEPDS